MCPPLDLTNVNIFLLLLQILFFKIIKRTDAYSNQESMVLEKRKDQLINATQHNGVSKHGPKTHGQRFLSRASVAGQGEEGSVRVARTTGCHFRLHHEPKAKSKNNKQVKVRSKPRRQHSQTHRLATHTER